mgnify:CR=1 FL=1
MVADNLWNGDCCWSNNGRSQFFIYFMGLSSIPGVICGAIADVINLILKLFISDYSGTWLTVIGQVIGHLSTIAI